MNRSWSMSLVCLTAALGFAVGCSGYRAGELYDPSIRTVAVPIFDNHSFERELEFQLTEAVIKAIEQRTPYKVTRSTTADTMIQGTILSVQRQMISRDFAAAVTQEAQLTVTVTFEWKDLRDGKIIRKRGRLQGIGRYIPARAVGEPIEVARQGAVVQLSDQVVTLMQADW